MAEEEIVRKKADEVRKKKEEMEMNKKYTVEDLTRGLLNYKFTGLTFEQGGRGSLRYVFFCITDSFYLLPFFIILMLNADSLL